MTVEARPRRAAHRPSRRQEIIEAAIVVFARKGISASIAEVAQETSMSLASIYYHFKGKPELFTACVSEVSRRIMNATSSQEPPEKLLQTREAVNLVWTWAEHHREEARLLYVWAVAGPPEAKAVRHRFEEFYVRRARRRMRRVGGSTPLDFAVERLASRTYMSLAMGVAEAWVEGHPLGGTLDQHRIAAALAEVSVRVTGVP
ncbi:TetR/AcrR family transcriptional regulator [Arthrobacter nitrophenolicus]|uniref:AcrR family transcriptional regulator n=2 Tax=Arthrobacter nitrophenolicus TaxID=683150 RepID=A0ACC6TKL4_9MICC|nr:TetR/AcrR family transcriptional regulator [Arthrobacter nitrophenolicus]